MEYFFSCSQHKYVAICLQKSVCMMGIQAYCGLRSNCDVRNMPFLDNGITWLIARNHEHHQHLGHNTIVAICHVERPLPILQDSTMKTTGSLVLTCCPSQAVSASNQNSRQKCGLPGIWLQNVFVSNPSHVGWHSLGAADLMNPALRLQAVWVSTRWC